MQEIDEYLKEHGMEDYDEWGYPSISLI